MTGGVSLKFDVPIGLKGPLVQPGLGFARLEVSFFPASPN